MNSKFSPAQLTKVGESLFGPRKMTDEEVETKLAELEAKEKAMPKETETEAIARIAALVENGLFDRTSGS